MRRQRGGVEDRWHKSNGEHTTRSGVGKRWRARYVDERGREHSGMFVRKTDAERWLAGQMASVVAGTHVAPRDAQITVAEWCELWLAGYAGHRKRTVECAREHIRRIIAEFGGTPLSALRPSMVKTWTAKLQAEGLSASYAYALHRRLSQLCTDACHDGVLGRNPCSRRTSPPTGKQKPYLATTEQIWALHDAMPERLRVAILLGAFAGLRVGEVCGLRIADVDFVRGVVHPVQQHGGAPLKTDGSCAPVPIPRELTLMLSASVAKFGSGGQMVTGERDQAVTRTHVISAVRQARKRVDRLPEGFSFHDLRHYFASLLIASGADIKTVQARLRHASATTTLNTYGHLWPDADESTRNAVGKVIAQRLGKAAAVPLRSQAPDA
jgi:integrase